jgi:hypothetical protein
MGVAGWRFARMTRTFTQRPAVVAVLEKLPLICPLLLAAGAVLLIGIALYRDWQSAFGVAQHVLRGGLILWRQ